MALIKYKLIGRLPVPCSDLLEWARWLETADRRVGQTAIGPFIVSTVFLGLDHGFRVTAVWDRRPADPLLFETMISVDAPEILRAQGREAWFDHTWLNYQERCATWDEAEQMHKRGVAHAEGLVAKASDGLGEWVHEREGR